MSNGALVEVFHLFSMYMKDKAFKYLKIQSFFLQFPVTLYIPGHIYLDLGRDEDDGYDVGESSDKDFYE